MKIARPARRAKKVKVATGSITAKGRKHKEDRDRIKDSKCIVAVFSDEPRSLTTGRMQYKILHGAMYSQVKHN